MNDFKEYSELYHHGVKGQRWGIRRYQNPDGSLTPEGKKKYLNPDGSLNKAGQKLLKKRYNYKNPIKKAAGIMGVSAIGAAGARHLIDLKRYDTNMINFRKAVSKQYPSIIKGNTVSPHPEYLKIIKAAENKITKRANVAALAIAGAGIGLTAFALYKNHKNKKRLEEDGKNYVDFLKTGKLNASKTDSSVTKKVKKTFNESNEKEFRQKSGVSKRTYANRVFKYGDPYMKSPLAKIGKAMSKNKSTNKLKISKAISKNKSLDDLKISKAISKDDRMDELRKENSRTSLLYTTDYLRRKRERQNNRNSLKEIRKRQSKGGW